MRKTTSDVDFPISRKGMKEVVWERGIFATEIIPTAPVRGNRIDKKISNTVVRQPRLLEEK